MSQQVIDLGFVLKQFPQFKFSMDSFNDRLCLQKFIYLLQTFDVYLGYDFSWYLHGPYCSTLAACGFALKERYHIIPDGEKMTFEDADIQQKFTRFMDFISGHETDIEFLEIAASLHYQKKICELSDNEIIKKVAAKRDTFEESKCREIWNMLKECGLINETPHKTGTALESMNKRYNDLAIYYMMQDAQKDNKFELTSKPIFRSNVRQPTPDKINADKKIIIQLLINQ